MEELISVIVPVYRVEEYINKCIDSIINQTYKNLEIILVDDGSPDKCGEICDEYAKIDSRIKVIHCKNQGVSNARNQGIKVATGSWISFIDADDWIDANYFKIMIENVKINNAEVIVCGYNRFTSQKNYKINSDGTLEIIDGREYLIRTLNPQTGLGFCHMKLYKKNIIEDIWFDTSIVVGEDALFNEKISNRIKNAVIYKSNIYNYRVNPNSVVRKYDENYAIKYLKSIRKNKEYLFKKYQDDIEIIQNYYNFVAFHVLLIAINYCFNLKCDRKKGKEKLKNVCSYNEFNEGIKKSTYRNLSITRKITLFTIKHRLFFLTELIGRYRQVQNNS